MMLSTSLPSGATPRARRAPNCHRNDAAEVLELAAAYGTVLDDWQRDAIEVGCGVREDGLWAAQTSVALVVRALAGPLLFGEQTVIVSAHQGRPWIFGLSTDILTVTAALGCSRRVGFRPMATGLGFKFGVAALALGLHLTGAGVAAAAPSNGADSDGGSRVVASKTPSGSKVGSLADLAAELAKKNAANREALLKYLEGLKKPKPVKAGKPVLTATRHETDSMFESALDAQTRLFDLYEELLRP